MPVMPNGTFRFYEDIQSSINTRRRIANAVLRLAEKRGIHNQAVDNAEAELKRCDDMEREYFNVRAA